MKRISWHKHITYAPLSTLLLMGFSLPAFAANETMGDFVHKPADSFAAQPPLVMLATSLDHQLFMKAYTDYSDINNDGTLDTTYNNNIEYYGYFYSDRCYKYSSTNGRFYRVRNASNHQCGQYNEWSGNFLNWATMSRIDILRKVLYGGYRSTDTASLTVLERSFITRDVHAFAKVYRGSDVKQYTPYSSSAISLCNYSASYTGGPQFAIASGAFPLWASDEILQCRSGSNVSPNSGDIKSTRPFVRVKVCDESAAINKEKGCQEYKDNSTTSHKPVGILQKFGGEDKVKFGLISGSHNKPRNGGVLRKNIGNFSDEISANGTFTSVSGIINTLNNYKMVEYSFGNRRYEDCNTYSIPKSVLGSRETRMCRNWGNPLSEIYLEALRYFAGQTSPTNNFNADDSAYNLPSVSSWSNPMTSDTACASCSIVMLSSGVNSFDGDELSTITDLHTSSTLTKNFVETKYTDHIGTNENGTKTNFISGGLDSSNSSNNDLCTSKTVSSLSDAVGVCPELPQLDSSYNLAGLAYYGHTNDLRPGNTFKGKQSVSMYAVELAENLPTFSFPVGSGQVSFVPACQADAGNGYASCSITNVVVESQRISGGKVVAGSLLISWEDSLWGSDYDLDAMQRIQFCVGSACNSTSVRSDQITIRSSMPYIAAGNGIRVGYTLIGTRSNDGVGPWVTRSRGGQNFNCLTSPNQNCSAKPSDSVVTRTAKARSPGDTLDFLQKPIYYAAKYGAFSYASNTESDAPNATPPTISSADSSQWDVKNNLTGEEMPLVNGQVQGDGIPDNYFFASNPANLERQLTSIFQSITNETGSGSSATVTSNNAGEGAMYQAIYQPKISQGGKEIVWGGILHAIFTDDCNRLREDTNSNGQLDGYGTDKAITIEYDKVRGKTGVQRWTATGGTATNCPTFTKSGGITDFATFKPVWSARDGLASLTDTQTQRTYNNNAKNGRHIFTYIDRDGGSDVDTGEIISFVPASFTGTGGLNRYLKQTTANASNLVKFIRGEEGIAGYRNRTIDYDKDNTEEKWLLGDIIHSSPAAVGAPKGDYGTVMGDITYLEFQRKYKDRRTMVYVGANDGMLHAFNGGKWDESTKSFLPDGHDLGTEMWAYVPQSVLPHLQWLKRSDYEHVYFVDGEVFTADVNIFSNDSTHPNGWGTILVASTGMGGGAITVDADGDSNNGEEVTLRSSYMVFDVTDPESAPKLLAEFSLPDNSYTLAKASLAYARVPSTNTALGAEAAWRSPSKNKWFLALGSGPDDASNMTSTSPAKVYYVDLSRIVNGGTPSIASGSSRGTNSFVGGVTPKDWDYDGMTDNLYFGTVGGTPAAATGALWRSSIRFTTSISESTSALYNPSLPFLAPPLVEWFNKKQWIFAGTGRYLTPDDRNNNQQNYFYGLLDSATRIATSSPVDVSGVKVYGDTINTSVITAAGGGNFTVDGNNVTTQLALRQAVIPKKGWRLKMPDNGRVLKSATRGKYNSVLASMFSPPGGGSCEISGTSKAFGLDSLSGLSAGIFGTDSSDKKDSKELRKIFGMPTSGSDNTLFLGNSSKLSSSGGANGGGTANQDKSLIRRCSSTGACVDEVVQFMPESNKRGRQSWREIKL